MLEPTNGEASCYGFGCRDEIFSREFTQRFMQMMQGGETSLSKLVVQQGDCRYSLGGGAVNTAICLRALDPTLNIRFCGAAGSEVLNDLAPYGIDTSLATILNPEPRSTVFSSGEDYKTIVEGRDNWDHVRFANDHILGCLVCLSGTDNPNLSAEIAAKLRCNFVAVNPGQKEIKDRSAIRQILQHASLVQMNFQEATLLVDRPCGIALEALCRLHGQGYIKEGQIAIVTDGKNGIYCRSTDGTIYHAQVGEESLGRYPLGCGDSTFATMAYCCYNEIPLDKALTFAAAQACSVAQYPNAHQGLKSLDELRNPQDGHPVIELEHYR